MKSFVKVISITVLLILVFPVIHRSHKILEITENDIDSVKFEATLKNAVLNAQLKINNDTFYDSYTVNEETIPTQIELNFGTHFSPGIKHLILKATDPGLISIRIYKISDGKFVKVMNHQEGTITNVNDTIQDINGDELKDFIVNWYGSSGCCLKAFSEVFILQKDKKTFNPNIQFINPTFSPKEKVVQGVCYGFPGETEMYKFRFQGDQIDTEEYVSFERNQNRQKTGTILITNSRLHMDGVKVIKRMMQVPEEYYNINGYDWFLGD